MNRPTDDARPAGAPGTPEPEPEAVATRRIPGHVLHTIRKETGVAPPHVEFFTESDPDGFSGDEPRFVAFCPDCGSKLTLEQHEDCPFFGGPETDRDGFVIAVHCGKKEPGREG